MKDGGTHYFSTSSSMLIDVFDSVSFWKFVGSDCLNRTVSYNYIMQKGKALDFTGKAHDRDDSAIGGA